MFLYYQRTDKLSDVLLYKRISVRAETEMHLQGDKEAIALNGKVQVPPDLRTTVIGKF
jgi:hypothetical protein